MLSPADAIDTLSGIEDPVVDAMRDQLVAARSMPELVGAARALDRVLLWNYYTIPQWYLDYHRIAYRSRLERPAHPAALSLAFQTWWVKAHKWRISCRSGCSRRLFSL